LIQNSEFRERFINRFADLLNSLLATPHTMARIDQMAAVLNGEMPEHIARWRHPGSFVEWRQNVEYLREYARLRPATCREHLIRRFDLSGIVQITLDAAPPGSGHVQVNSIVTPIADGSWTGIYFRGLPIHLQARPQPGYRFAGWDGLSGVSKPSVVLELAADWRVTARFEIDPAARPTLVLIRAEEGIVRMEASGLANSVAVLEASRDLDQWTFVRELTLDATGRASVALEMEPSEAAVFYRMRLGASPQFLDDGFTGDWPPKV
jgi:hypothetical protein